ncbi:MAG: hypothetical protein ACREFI_20345 [Stellaceae bacterium]
MNIRAALLTSAFLLLCSTALAETRSHDGVVESISTRAITVRNADGSVGHWRLDEKTLTVGRRPEAGDRVRARVESNGHVAELRFETRAKPPEKDRVPLAR